MGRILSRSLDKLDDPIFDSSYEIYSPKRKISTKSSQKNTDSDTMKKPSKKSKVLSEDNK